MLFIVEAAILILLAAFFMFCWRLSNRIINIKALSSDETRQVDADDNISSMNWYEQLGKEQHWVPSAFGYQLYAEFVPAKRTPKGTMVFSHGVWCRVSIMPRHWLRIRKSIAGQCLNS